MKKFASLALALVLALALAIPAFAQNVDAGNGEGSITIKNAVKGEEYTIYKLFDAQVSADGKGITYTGVIPESLKDYFEEDAQSQIVATEAAVDANNNLNAEAVNAMQAWAKNVNTSDQYPSASAEAAGDGLTFINVPYGYYVVISRSDNAQGGAISVTSTTPNATIADKNTTGNDPHFPEEGGKKVTTESGTNTVAVGETVTYTITYNAVNWVDKDGDSANGAEAQVRAYAFKDTLPGFLDDVRVTSVVVTDANGEHEISNPPQFVKDFDLPIMIGWTDHSTDANMNDVYTSKYTNGAVIKITYTAVVNEKVLEAGEGNHKNEISAYPVFADGNGSTDTTDEDIYTGSVIINKFETGNDTKKLAGAEFVLVRASAEGVGDEFENVFEYCVIDEKTKAVSWTEDAEKATSVTTDDNGAASFDGLASGTYYLFETKAPAGYNKLAEPVKAIVTAATNANVVFTADVANNTGAVLPSTGGIGTTIFYVGGGILVAGAAILLITKKRMGAAD